MDAVIAWVDRLPGPPWATYAVLTALSIAAVVVLRMIDHAAIEPVAIVYAGLTFTPFAFMHAINRAARAALADFRPALGDLESEYPRLERQLTTTSFATGLVGAAIGVGIVAAGVLSAGNAWGVAPDNMLITNVVGVGLLVILNAGVTTFFLHEFGHLRAITRIHRLATGIALWDARSHRAFSRVTAMAAIAITVPYVSAALLSALSDTQPIVATSAVIVSLALATVLFAGPLLGMRRRLRREKEELLGATDRSFEQVATALRTRIDGRDFAGAAELESVLGGLAIERERLKKVSTWPWSADTLRAFLTSLGLPVLLWFVTTVLGRLLFA